MKKIVIPILLLSFVTTISCTNDNLEDLTTSKGIVEVPIDTTKTITFSGDVLPIINNDCLPCHGTNGSSINLTTHRNFNNHAENSLDYINSGYMPKGRTKLSNNKILTIKTWIDDGKKNN